MDPLALILEILSMGGVLYFSYSFLFNFYFVLYW